MIFRAVPDEPIDPVFSWADRQAEIITMLRARTEGATAPEICDYVSAHFEHKVPQEVADKDLRVLVRADAVHAVIVEGEIRYVITYQKPSSLPN